MGHLLQLSWYYPGTDCVTRFLAKKITFCSPHERTTLDNVEIRGSLAHTKIAAMMFFTAGVLRPSEPAASPHTWRRLSSF